MSDMKNKPGPWFGGRFEGAIRSGFEFGPCDDFAQGLLSAEPGYLVRNDDGDCVLRLSDGMEDHITDRDLVLTSHADSKDLPGEVFRALGERFLQDLDGLEEIAGRLKNGPWSAEMDRFHAGGDFIVRHQGNDVLKLSLDADGRHPEATAPAALMSHAASLLIRMDGMLGKLRREKEAANEVALAENEKKIAQEVESDLGSFGF